MACNHGPRIQQSTPPELWLPGAGDDIPRMPGDDPDQDLSANRCAGYLRAVGRLKHGERWRRRTGGRSDRPAGARESVRRRRCRRRVQSMREQLFGAVRRPLLVLVGPSPLCWRSPALTRRAYCSAGRPARRRESLFGWRSRESLRIIRQLLPSRWCLRSAEHVEAWSLRFGRGRG